MSIVTENSRRRKCLILVRILIVIISFIVMFKYANKYSLWADDLATISFIGKNLSMRQIISRLAYEAKTGNPPLYYAIAFIWIRIVPFGTQYIKLFNIILTCIGIWFIGTAARQIGGGSEDTGVFAEVFAATSFFITSFEAYTFRSQGLIFLLCPIYIIIYYNKLREPKSKTWNLLFVFVIVLLLYTNYMSVLIIGVTGLLDLFIYIRKQQRIYFLVPYIISGLCFLPYVLWVIKGFVENHTEFWPSTPNFYNYVNALKVIFSYQPLSFAFFIGEVILFFALLHKDNSRLLLEIKWTNALCIIWPIFVFNFVYLYSAYINPKGSFFLERYFISIIVPICICCGLFCNQLLQIIFENDKGRVISAIIIGQLFSVYLLSEIEQINTNPGQAWSPYEGNIEWIYSHPLSLDERSLTIITPYKWIDGVRYYTTHNWTRKDLNLGNLTEENYQQYDYVFVSPLHGDLDSEEIDILQKHFVEVERNDTVNAVLYQKNY